MAELTYQQLQKLGPKLRVVRNGTATVNTLRAERTAALAVDNQALLQSVPLLREPQMLSFAALPETAKKGKQRDIPKSVFVNVFIELVADKQEVPSALQETASETKQNLVIARIPLSELDELVADENVNGIELGEQIAFSPPISVTAADDNTPIPSNHIPGAETHGDGAGVLIGIIDVQGFDFSHPDFLDEDQKTRFISIWDQGGSTRPAPHPYDFGAELKQEHLNAAIAASPTIGLAPYQLEPQSQMSQSSHGTHVASIAAGNHGICSKADLAAVLISLPTEDMERRKSFYDSTRIAHAVDYLFNLGKERGQPVSINISLGTNGHAHDASSAIDRWVDYTLATAGRSVCVAAGNAGQEAPAEEGDIGFIMGRIHTGGQIAAAGLTQDIEWIVVGDGIADLSENELEIWYSPQDRFEVSLKPPGSSDWIGPVRPGEFIENQMLDDGTFVSIYNELYNQANGANYIACYLSPFFSPDAVVGVKGGAWTMRLHGLEIRDGTYHGWIERDDPRRLGDLGFQEAWSFPSFFTLASNVDNSSVSSLACGQRIISIANLDEERDQINVTSSQGPTRDNREKPEISAPGTDILAANGFDPLQSWVQMTGTSMASPYVAGVIGLMLALEPTLTAAQIGGILRRTAEPLPSHDFQWRNDAGFGRIDPEAAIAEADTISDRRDLTP